MINNYKLHGNKILNIDFKEHFVVGSFNNVLTREIKKKLILDLVYGREMLQVYKNYRDDLHITAVVEMLQEMEDIFADWDREYTFVNKECQRR